jgi:FkbH-like protein
MSIALSIGPGIRAAHVSAELPKMSRFNFWTVFYTFYNCEPEFPDYANLCLSIARLRILLQAKSQGRKLSMPEFSPSDRRKLSCLIESRRSTIVDRWYACQFDPERLRRFEIAGVNNVERQTLVDLFLTPLLNLLTGYLRSGDASYQDVYLDERLRYAPHTADITVRESFFSEVLPSDEDAIIREITQDGELLRTFLTRLHAPLLSSSAEDSVRLLALGDCLMNEIRVFLPSRCKSAGINLDARMLYFSAATGKDLQTGEAIQFLSTNPTDLIALSFLTYEGLPPYSLLLREADRLSQSEIADRVAGITGLMRKFMLELRERTEVPFLLHNSSGLPLSRLRRRLPVLPPLSRPHRIVSELINSAICELAENIPNTILIDERSVAASRGYRKSMAAVIPAAISGKSFFHTSRFGEYLADSYLEVIRAYRDLGNAKVLLLDFDETLWEGVMAEEAVRQFSDRQRLLRQLREEGILLVAVSKNNPQNLRWSEMILQPSDFALSKVSWNTKVQSIQEAAQELDLGIDSFVLIDDSATERELVRASFPKIRTLDSTSPDTWRSLQLLLSFPNTRKTEEARARTELYRAQAARREAMSQAVDYPGMMASLGLEARFGLASDHDLNRVNELIQRTNQFNTTTARYSRAQLRAFLSDDEHRVYVSHLSDKYSNLGLVAVVIIRRSGGDAIFDSFVMSCRAMGFGLERLMLCLVLDAEKDVSRFIGKFVPTDRNRPASTIFSDAGFRPISESDSLLEAAQPRPEAPSWFRVSSLHAS